MLVLRFNIYAGNKSETKKIRLLNKSETKIRLLNKSETKKIRLLE